jgi:aspartate kinase
MGIVVQKFGGKSLATVSAIKGIAGAIATRHFEGQHMVIVVSAMGQTTDELIQKAYEISPRPNRRELDMLLTTGERVSMTLLSMALNDLGVSAISFTGSQAGVLTDDSHSQARIINIQAPRVLEALQARRVVVLAGFQGVSPSTKEITTLGRGGSDTTAVAMAGFLRAERCEILKDVDGIYSADPKVVPESFKYHNLPLRSVRAMCFWGAKVLHVRAADLADQLSIPLYIGSALHPERGTLLKKESQMYEKQTVIGVTSHRSVANVSLATTHLHHALQTFFGFLDQEHLPTPTVLSAQVFTDHCELLLTNDEEGLHAAVNFAIQRGVLKGTGPGLSSVTMTGFGFQAGQVLPRMLEKLAAENILVHRTLLGTDSLTALVNPDQREAAVRALHTFVSAV